MHDDDLWLLQKYMVYRHIFNFVVMSFKKQPVVINHVNLFQRYLH